jgi:hypothetical protein
MKNICAIFIIICLIFTLSACKKDKNTNVDNSQVAGKWQEIKLRVYVQNQTGAISNDTTYLAPAFSSLDYIQFYSNDTCVIATDRFYFPAGEKSSFSNSFTARKFKYQAAGSLFIISQIFFSPGGFLTADTATLVDEHHLKIHAVSYQGIPANKTISDGYYTR